MQPYLHSDYSRTTTQDVRLPTHGSVSTPKGGSPLLPQSHDTTLGSRDYEPPHSVHPDSRTTRTMPSPPRSFPHHPPREPPHAAVRVHIIMPRYRTPSWVSRTLLRVERIHQRQPKDDDHSRTALHALPHLRDETHAIENESRKLLSGSSIPSRASNERITTRSFIVGFRITPSFPATPTPSDPSR